MRPRSIFLLLVIACLGAGWAAFPSPTTSLAPLSRYVPAGGLLYLEAKDFSSLLTNWNASPEKRNWLRSADYEVFSRSRLLLRLKGAGEQFSAAAGLPPDMDFVSQVAGSQSALALYDIGNLQFLYITYLPGKSVETTLWQTRSKFEPRSAAGVTFYLRRDPESQREVAFAIQGDYLLLATREDLMAGALTLLSGSNGHSIESEPWWSQAVARAGPSGDLRMVLNLEKIVPTPYFRTYWVQRNISEMKQFSAAISDLFRSGNEDREERMLIRKDPAAAPNPAALEATADLIRLVPENTGVYEAKASPSSTSCFNLLETKLLGPHLGPVPASELAPRVQLTGGEGGASTDLETRIDQAPAEHQDTKAKSTLEQLLDQTQILASLQVQSTETDKAGVFVRIHSAIVLVAASDWNESSARSTISDFLAPSLTASHLGLGWKERTGYQELDGLLPLALAVKGKYLVIADEPALIASIVSNFSRPAQTKPATLIAGFNHGRERDSFSRLATIVDRNNPSPGNFGSSERQPQFFSENMASLSQAFKRISSENLAVRVEGNRVFETVTYQWSQ